ncbi:MAG: YdcF family protein [Candidatus Nealsonbacteria bacterium]|nr:YdcF family protein [Candidatus Nealsonbacteria bacterium]
MRRRRILLWASVLAVVALAALYPARHPLLRGVGQWLDVGADPRPADYVMPLGGDENTRPFAAAELIRDGKASRAIVANIRPSSDTDAGLVPTTHGVMRQVLMHYDVASEDIVTIGDHCDSTYDEARALAGFLQGHPDAHVIVVTGHYHTRRTRWIFHRVLADRSAQVSFASAPAHNFRLETWWSNERGAELVVAEYLKLTYYAFRYGQAASWTIACLVLASIAWAYRKYRPCQGGANVPCVSSPSEQPTESAAPLPAPRSAQTVRFTPGRRRRAVDLLLKAACLAYLLTLSLLLLCEDPLRPMHVGAGLLAWLRPLVPVSHLLSFLTLTVLAMAARWPRSRWQAVVLLLAYAGGTELLQGCVADRTPEWVDLFQNVAGIAIGMALWLLVTNLATRLTGRGGTTGRQIPS